MRWCNASPSCTTSFHPRAPSSSSSLPLFRSLSLLILEWPSSRSGTSPCPRGEHSAGDVADVSSFKRVSRVCGASRNTIPAALNFSNGSRRTRVSSVFSEIFFLLATWTLTKLRPRVGAQPNFRLRETNDHGLVPPPRPPPPYSNPLHERDSTPAISDSRLPPFCFFTLSRVTRRRLPVLVPLPRRTPPGPQSKLLISYVFE